MIRSSFFALPFLLLTAGIGNVCRAASVPNEQEQTAFQDNDVLLSGLLKQLQLKREEIREDLFVAKVWPHDPSLSIVVIPKIAQQEDDNYGNSSYVLDAYVLLVDKQTGSIRYRFYEAEAWTSDALVLSGIEIDTAPYRLNGSTRAFGIRVSYRGSSQPNPYNQTDLSLFVTKGNILQPVLKNYTIDRFGGEWDTRCAGEFDEMGSVIVMDKAQTNGYQNIILKQKLKHTVNHQVGEDCQEKETIQQKTVVLKYNKQEYR